MDYEKHLPLAPRDLLILSVLAEGPLHGYGIIKAVELRSRSGVLLDPANLYRVLRRMRRVGWISEAETGGGRRRAGDLSASTAQAAEKNEARRRTYQITATGRAILAAELKRLERLLRYATPAVAGAPGSHDSSEGG
jgi:DNA-binding PadR family transcriptional regulator